MERKLEKSILIKMYFRSFFILAVHNYERMQNLGFLFIIAPVLKKLFPDKLLRTEAYLRHLEFFNVHPYLVTLPAGKVAALEEEKVDGKTISSMKLTMGGPIAAVGDSLFWATWRPFCSFFILCIMFLTGAVNISDNNLVLKGSLSDLSLMIYPVMFLILYNVPGLLVRYWGLKSGYGKDEGLVELMKKVTMSNVVQYFQSAGHVLTSCIAVIIFITMDMSFMNKLLLLSSLFSFALLVIRGIPVLVLFYGLMFAIPVLYFLK